MVASTKIAAAPAAPALAGVLAAPALTGVLAIPIALIERDAGQPRRDWRTDWVYDPKDNAYKQQQVQYRRLEELAESIRAVGLLQPIVVRSSPAKPGHYLVVAGHRRRRAAEMAGLREVPVVIRETTEAELRVLQLIENVQRQDLTPMDEARAYDELMALRGLSAAQVARHVHVSYQHVINRLRVLRDDVLREAVEARQISASVAREITKLRADEAADLRRRIQAGERVQLRTVADIRARLVAAGIVNPRRKNGRAAEQEDVAPSPIRQDERPAIAATLQPALAQPIDVLRRATELAPWRIAPLTYEPRASTAAAAPSTSAATAAQAQAKNGRAGRDGTSASHSRPERATQADQRWEALVQTLSRQSHAQVKEVLDYGVRRGWSCAALADFVQHARRGANGDPPEP